jgi:hypothetical protein
MIDYMENVYQGFYENYKYKFSQDELKYVRISMSTSYPVDLK